MKITLCGVRGSTPAPGPEFIRFGGHTSCVAVTPEGAERPRLILDAGTGLRSVSALLDGQAFEGTILLTHLHWDHVQGLPFFTAGDRDDADVHLLVPDDGVEAATQIRRAMSPPHFPIGPEGLRGRWCFDTIDTGTRQVEGLTVVAGNVPHKGGRTLGFRLTDERGSLAYVPDHLPAAGGSARQAVLELVRDVDVLLHDAQFLASETRIADPYGHATIEQAVDLAVEAGARELVLFHHAPGRTDDELDRLAECVARSPLPVSVAVEGTSRTVGVATGVS